jgi:hypothetical protein
MQTGKHTPLSLDTEKHPDPATKHLQHLDGEDAALEIIEMVEVGRQLQAPRAAQDEVERDDEVVEARVAEVEDAAEAPGVVGRVALVFGREEREVPVLGHVPVEGVEGVDEDEQEPGSCVSREMSFQGLGEAQKGSTHTIAERDPLPRSSSLLPWPLVGAHSR